ncbi:hypothetical protein QW131_03310 [Roseibium salinum]|nr:hypothetical protein [Roseibium salinum]
MASVMIFGNCLDRNDRFLRRRLDFRNVGGDFLGRFGGLGGQFLHFRGDDGEAFAGLAGSCRLDRRIEGKKIGLFCDRLDQRYDVPDPLGGAGQAGDLGIGVIRPLRGLVDNTGRRADLP